jgi:hypothetical protein
MIGRVRVKPFWMVYGMGQGAPTVRHASEEAAVAEATRLARRNPDVAFVVLAATHSVLKRDVEIDRIDADFAEIPLWPPEDQPPF